MVVQLDVVLLGPGFHLFFRRLAGTFSIDLNALDSTAYYYGFTDINWTKGKKKN